MASETKRKFGTFSGVFIPSILTIFGPIMFMRFNFVIGNVGIWQTLVILIIAQSITMSTAFSLAAISTNTEVLEGGAYYLISRSLGAGFGGAIGITLFCAQALSVPFYIIGFTEALLGTFPALQPYYTYIAVATGLILFYLAWSGAHWALKVQVFIFVLLMLSIIVFLWGAGLNFDINTFSQNLAPVSEQRLFVMFAIFFPAVTGIMAGVNMSGDLKNPGYSLAAGTFYAVIFATIIYGIEIFICGGAFSREALIQAPYLSLVNNAIFGLGFLVIAGVFAATISSAIGSYLGAPRVLRALSRDSIIPGIKIFSKDKIHDEPRKALILTTVITIIVLIWAGFTVGSKSDKDPLNIIAQIVTMFFLYTYGMINLAAFVESFGKNPSFRPRFKYFHWAIALFGLITSGTLSFMIDLTAAFAALFFFIIIFYIAKKREMQQSFGDARRGFLYSRVRNMLIDLNDTPLKSKNWRPTIAVLTGTLLENKERLNMLKYAIDFEGGKGLISVVDIIVGKFESLKKVRLEKLLQMKKFLKEKNIISAFPEVIVTDNFDSALSAFIQTHSIGQIKPNIIMMGCPKTTERKSSFVDHMRMIKIIGKSIIIFKCSSKNFIPEKPTGKYIDIWWRGMQNGSLMFILAYLLQNNPIWKDTTIRLLRTIAKDSEYASAKGELEKLIKKSRIQAESKVIYSDNYRSSLFEYSMNSAAVFMGTYIPKKDNSETYFEGIDSLTRNMPPTFFIYSSGDADLLA